MSFSFPAPAESGDSSRPRSCSASAESVERWPRQSRGLGLVHTQTSGKPIHVDPLETRLRRMRHSCITGSRLHQEAVTRGGFRGRWAFLTLTYADVKGWSPRDLPELSAHIRKWLHRRGHRFGYVWVAELQQRGAMHYHMLIWLPKGLTLPKPDKQGWWRHGWTKIEWARNPVGYMAKYASKGDGPTKFPKGARIHGCGGLRGAQLQEGRYWKRPAWLREQTEIGQPVKRKAGGGWLDLDTGEVFVSPWRVFFEGGGVWIYLAGAEGENAPLAS